MNLDPNFNPTLNSSWSLKLALAPTHCPNLTMPLTLILTMTLTLILSPNPAMPLTLTLTFCPLDTGPPLSNTPHSCRGQYWTLNKVWLGAGTAGKASGQWAPL